MIKGKCVLYIDEPMLEGHWFFALPDNILTPKTGMEAILDLDHVYGRDVIITYEGNEVFSGYTGFEPIPEGVKKLDWIKWFKEGAYIEMGEQYAS